ncbi:MAG: DUF3990 domain-containing protein [Clostridia bacterium]|nr:DUF3990 domain-containing protein [Clostridia bacterium]
MIIYHGSNVTVEEPRILTPNRYLDFGAGFYTTTNYDQALNFSGKVTMRKKCGRSTVNIYELDESIFEKVNVLNFESADEAWLDFVSDNRSGIDRTAGYDLICGPVADDDVYQTFILYSTGVYTKEQTIEALKIKKLYNQYVFTTDRALSYLTFKEVKFGKERFDG